MAKPREARPRVITTDAENQRALAELEALDDPAAKRALTPEEAELRFEDARYDLGKASPADALRGLMEVRGLRQRDLIPLFGSSGVASEVLNGKRSISKTHARKLAEFLHVPVGLFI
jgi:HTH-type transcriptional regulator/antitoxin HigA